jgi:SNF2 family DNA or RNA helicase
VLIIQYEMVMSAPDLRMLKTIKWTYMVVDEGHRLKNKDSKLFVVLTKEYSTHRKLILTGTPLQNNIGELWNLLNFLLPTVCLHHHAVVCSLFSLCRLLLRGAHSVQQCASVCALCVDQIAKIVWHVE